MLQVEVQRACSGDGLPGDEEICSWAHAVAAERSGELTIRIVEAAEMQALNGRYRGKHRPTNVLSFPAEELPGIDDAPLGDIAICAAVVENEANAQKKELRAHWAHMVVHGTLHILGYDHVSPDEADEMEGLERNILESLGFPDPYLER